MKKEQIGVGFKLQGIKTEQFALFEALYNSKKETGLSTQLEFKLNYTNQQIGVYLGFEFIQGKNIFIKIIVSCHFKITDDSWNNFIQADENKIVIPKGFLTHMALITTGTTRGVLFAKTEHTTLSKFIIPTIDLTKMIIEDASFAMEK